MELDNKVEYCGHLPKIKEMQEHWTVEKGYIQAINIKKDCNSGQYGWIEIKYNSITSFTAYFKELIKRETLEGHLI